MRLLRRWFCVLKHGSHQWLWPTWVLSGEPITMRCLHCGYSYTRPLAGVPEKRKVS